MIIIVYLFSIWAYVFLEDSFIVYCDSLFMCFKTVFDQGIKNSGGIGQFLDYLAPPPADTIDYQRFFYDNLHEIIIE